MIENLRKILDTNRSTKHRIETLVNQFARIQTKFIKELQEIPKTNLDDDFDFSKNLSSIIDYKFTPDKVQLAVCGPNSCGKTSFLHNFLRIGAILPARAGPVSARIVKLTYASRQEACLNVYSSIIGGLSLQNKPDMHIDLYQFFENESNINWSGIQKEISEYLERPTDLSDEDFTNWARSFVEIRIPSPILELDIDIYDTPGYLFHDKLITKDNLYDLVKLVRPMLIFMYDNSSVADDAHSCFLAIKSTLGDLEDSGIFFLNTKQDVMTIFDGAGINSTQRNLLTEKKFNEIFPKEREKRLKLLLNTSAMANYVRRNESKYENFDICSLPKPRSLLAQCANQMTESAVYHIIQFALKVNLERPLNLMKKILNLIDNFFQFFLTTSHRDLKQWKKIRDDALAWGITFFKTFEEGNSKQIDIAYLNILRYFNQQATNICERAIKQNSVNSSSDTKTEYSIKQFIEIAVREEIVKVAVNEIINQTKDTLRISLTKEIVTNFDNNELLISAQRQVLIDISPTELEQRTWFENIVLNISLMPTIVSRILKGLRTRFNVEYWKTTKRDDFQTEEEYNECNEVLDSFEELIQPDKRKDFAASYIKKMKDDIEKQEMLFKKNLKDWFENREKCFFENIYTNYSLAIQNLSVRQTAYEKTNLYVDQYARLQCQFLAIKYFQKFNGQIPNIDRSMILDQTYSFVTYSAEWGEKKNLVAKKFYNPNLQYIETHFHYKITRIRIPHVAPLLYVYTNPENENDLWVFSLKYQQSLADYLQQNIQTIKPDEIIQIALDIANVLVKLHAYEIVHCNLKSDNIFLDENNRCYTLPSQHDSVFVSKKMTNDIYSFGVLLYELLPKLEYESLPISDETNISYVKDLLKSNSRFDINNYDYEFLIESCFTTKVQRPTALELVQKLERIKKQLEQKVCIICETRGRKYRCYPCGHKVLCEICFKQQTRNNQEQYECILCRQAIEKWQEDDNDQTLYIKN